MRGRLALVIPDQVERADLSVRMKVTRVRKATRSPSARGQARRSPAIHANSGHRAAPSCAPPPTTELQPRLDLLVPGQIWSSPRGVTRSAQAGSATRTWMEMSSSLSRRKTTLMIGHECGMTLILARARRKAQRMARKYILTATMRDGYRKAIGPTVTPSPLLADGRGVGGRQDRFSGPRRSLAEANRKRAATGDAATGEEDSFGVVELVRTEA